MAVDWPSAGCSVEGVASGVQEGRARVNEVELRWLAPDAPGCWPALVLVPPGLEEGLPELDEAEELAAARVFVVAFDPPGRGQSPGEEDHGGPTQQHALAAVLAWTAARDEVDPTRVGLRTRSYGLVMAAGALAGWPELDPLSLVDIEGPVRLPEDLEHVPDHSRETLTAAATGEAWWEERSPSEHLGQVRAHYRRIQALEDHATGLWLGHAQSGLNLAVEGEAARVDLNGVERELWSYEEVEEDALEGRVKHDDDRAVELILDALRP